MNFYTNVFRCGNNILYRGVYKGRRIKKKVNFSPSLFVLSTNNHKTDWKTLNGEYLEIKTFDNINKASDFVKKYKDVDNIEIYGNQNYQYAFISEKFDDIIDWNKEYIFIDSIDIEVGSENGFPDPTVAEEEITAITVSRYKGHTISFGCGDYEVKGDEKYVKCSNERDLCLKFLSYWNYNCPDIITGWNCIPTNQYVWGHDKIYKMSDITPHAKLFDRDVVRVSPVSLKKKYDIYLSLSSMPFLSASIDHKIPVRSLPIGKYSNLKVGGKSLIIERTLTVGELMIDEDYHNYIECPIHKNDNPDCLDYKDSELYLSGLVYTDGTKRTWNDNIYGFRVYQSDYDMLTKVCDKYDITQIYGPSNKGSYNISFKKDKIGNCIDLIYINGEKQLNIEKLSTLSERQFNIFLSGLLDGDGYVDGTSFGFCCYSNGNDDLNKVSNLLFWNGIFNTRSNNTLRFVCDKNSLCLLKDKRWGNFNPKSFHGKYSSNIIKYRRVGNSYWVKINKIEDSGEVVEMMDIETTDNLFVSNAAVVHNCQGFDIPYLVNRFTRVLGIAKAKELSPWKIVNSRTKYQRLTGKEVTVYSIAGVAVLDYMDLYKTFAKNGKSQENYTLNNIANVEIGEEKISYDEYDNLHQLYKHNFQKFIEYNIKDTSLIFSLDNKLKLIDLAITLAYDSKSNYEDVFTQTVMWDSMIYDYLIKKNIVVPPKIIKNKSESFEGAYVKEPQIGMHNFVGSFDLNSLYPNLIRQYNISPEKLVDSGLIFDRIKLLKSKL